MTTAFDGIWVSDPLTKSTMDAALTKSGFDPSKFHPWFEDWTGIDHRIYMITIGKGRWVEKDLNDGVTDGGFEGPIELADPSTIVVKDTDNACQVAFHLSATSASSLTMEVGDDTCGQDDVLVETAIYEASPFKLIQAADWKAPDFSPANVPSPTPRGPSTSATRLSQRPAGTVAGAPLGYLEYLPPGYSPTAARAPLIVFLHGSSESGAGDPLGLGNLAGAALPGLISHNLWPDSRPFVVLAPQHDDSKPPSFCLESSEIDAFLTFAVDRYNVDPARIYLTGLSCGAIGMWNYLDEHAGDTIAAAVPIAGNGLQAIADRGCNLGAVPIWAFHGALDPNVPAASEIYPMTTLIQCTAPAPVDARLTVFPKSGHDVWSRTYSDQDGYNIYDWMLSHHH